MIDRRRMVFGAALLVAAPSMARAALPIPAGNRLGFDITRKGSRLGTHVLTFEPDGDDLVVKVAVDLVFKLAFITLFRYSHRATERWSAGDVVGLDTTTTDNGDKSAVTGRRTAQGLAIEATKLPRYIAPANALPATHWNRRQLDGPWINTQNGKLVRPKVTPEGIDTIPAAKGPLRANHFALSGDVQLDIWYDTRPSWAGLAFKGKDGSEIRYERQ